MNNPLLVNIFQAARNLIHDVEKCRWIRCVEVKRCKVRARQIFFDDVEILAIRADENIQDLNYVLRFRSRSATTSSTIR